MSSETDPATSAGQVLAGRYRLERLITGSRQPVRLWRGEDVVLQRPVAVKTIPSDDPAAAALLTAALGSGKVGHPGLARVFDADEQDGYTYVVSEWVDGLPLHRLLLNEDVLSATRASHLVAEAAAPVAAAHAQGMAHGNLHPGNILVAPDGTVRLTDLRGEDCTRDDADRTRDVQCLGAVLYAGLTGRWPGPGAAQGMTAAPTYDGRTATPRQVRAGVPAAVSDLTMRALSGDPALTADRLAADLTRHSQDPGTGRLPMVDYLDPAPRRRRWQQAAAVSAVVVVVVVAGLIIGVNTGVVPPLGGLSYPSYSNDKPSPSASPQTVIRPRSARILDPEGDGTELAGAGRAIDGNPATGWQTQDYTSAAFGRLKSGMGVLVDLGTSTQVGEVTVTMAAGGGRVELRSADSSASTAAAYTLRARSDNAGQTITFTPTGDTPARYWLVWITRLPLASDGAYSADVREITFRR